MSVVSSSLFRQWKPTETRRDNAYLGKDKIRPHLPPLHLQQSFFESANTQATINEKTPMTEAVIETARRHIIATHQNDLARHEAARLITTYQKCKREKIVLTAIPSVTELAMVRSANERNRKQQKEQAAGEQHFVQTARAAPAPPQQKEKRTTLHPTPPQQQQQRNSRNNSSRRGRSMQDDTNDINSKVSAFPMVARLVHDDEDGSGKPSGSNNNKAKRSSFLDHVIVSCLVPAPAKRQHHPQLQKQRGRVSSPTADKRKQILQRSCAAVSSAMNADIPQYEAVVSSQTLKEDETERLSPKRLAAALREQEQKRQTGKSDKKAPYSFSALPQGNIVVDGIEVRTPSREDNHSRGSSRRAKHPSFVGLGFKEQARGVLRDELQTLHTTRRGGGEANNDQNSDSSNAARGETAAAPRPQQDGGGQPAVSVLLPQFDRAGSDTYTATSPRSSYSTTATTTRDSIPTLRRKSTACSVDSLPPPSGFYERHDEDHDLDVLTL